jgi:hypothetical protein
LPRLLIIGTKWHGAPLLPRRGIGMAAMTRVFAGVVAWSAVAAPAQGWVDGDDTVVCGGGGTESRYRFGTCRSDGDEEEPGTAGKDGLC